MIMSQQAQQTWKCPMVNYTLEQKGKKTIKNIFKHLIYWVGFSVEAQTILINFNHKIQVLEVHLRKTTEYY